MPARLDPPPEVAGWPQVAAARRLAADLLAPAAQEVDEDAVPLGHLQALAAAGLLGVSAPVDVGGGAVPPAVAREVTELLAGACGATWLVAAQHASPLRAVLDSANPVLRDRWARPLASGEVLAGVAFSHLRRPGDPLVRAARTASGWRIDGRVGWYTGWGLNSIFLLAARTGDDVLFALVPAREQPGLTATAPLRLAAMAGARTVGLELGGLQVPEEDVVRVQPYDEWAAADVLTTANVTPAVFGLLRTVLPLLADAGARRGEAAAPEVADRLAAETLEVRARAYGLIDEVPPGERLDERLALRAHALELGVRASAALVAAGAGGALVRTAPAQRLAREALFHLVQAQTPAVRAATLARFAPH